MTQAVILAAGEGSRLYPVTTILPKIMFPVTKQSIPLGEFIVEKCKEAGITDIVLCINKERGKYIKNYFRDGSFLGVNIHYSESPEPLGTAGELYHAYKNGLIYEDFILYYGDTLTDIDLQDFIETTKDAKLGVAVYKDYRLSVGYVAFINKIPLYVIEKPSLDEIFNNGGYDIGVVEPIFYVKDISFLSKLRYNMDFVSEVIGEIIKLDGVCVYPHRGMFLDIGTWKNYNLAKDL